MRLAVDVGGTFTDLVVENDSGALSLHKSPTTPDDPIVGVLEVVAEAARTRGQSQRELLEGADAFLHATTRAINAVLTGATARTGLLVTEGHRDVLVFREGGRTGPFDFSRPYPEPYVPRALTFEVIERVGADGTVARALDEDRARRTIRELAAQDVEAVAVCLLWSIVNPEHELRVGELVREELPSIPVTLSHQLNPALREYRRASSAAIDASLKPVMTEYLHSLQGRLRQAGFCGQLLMVTSAGGAAEIKAVARAPIHSLNSGPSMAPIAGRHYATLAGDDADAIVADTGGTSFDISLVRGGHIPRTRDAWLGDPHYGHLTGFSSVDVKSIGSGGGSIAWVDEGGLLHVGPQSAGSEPGPACYGRGGTAPTVTDASLVLGFIDAEYFLGGAMKLDRNAAAQAIAADVAKPLGMDVDEAAAAILALATDHMVRTIEDITVNQGIDPTGSLLVAGGGAAGLTAVALARRLGCRKVAVPSTGAALSAAGALLSPLRTDFERHFLTRTDAFDLEGARRVVDGLRGQADEFIASVAELTGNGKTELTVEARYPEQVWELELALESQRFEDDGDVRALEEAFHALHRRVFAIADPGSPVEVVGWRMSAVCELGAGGVPTRPAPAEQARSTRRVLFPGHGWRDAAVVRLETIAADDAVEGPAIVETPFTTVVIEPDAVARATEAGDLAIEIARRAGAGAERPADHGCQPAGTER